MNTRHDLADAGFDGGLLAQFSNILAAFANDDAGIFC
jgi:hypothetical protein